MDGPAALLINAHARQGARAEAAVTAALARQGVSLTRVARIRRPSRLAEAVEALLRQGVRRLIVGAGDGTIGTVAARLARRDVALGVIPLGTANDFARTVGIPLNIPAAAAVAAGAHVRAIDLARANDEFFLNVASIGMSATLTTLLSVRLKRRLGAAAYMIAGALAFTRHPTFFARVDSPAGAAEGIVHQVVVGNGRYYGGGVLVARDSTLDDGLLTVYTLGRRGRWRLLRTVALLRLRVPLTRPGDVYLRVPSAFVETLPAGLRVNLDGELRTTTPVTFTVVPQALRVLTPAPNGSA